MILTLAALALAALALVATVVEHRRLDRIEHRLPTRPAPGGPPSRRPVPYLLDVSPIGDTEHDYDDDLVVDDDAA